MINYVKQWGVNMDIKLGNKQNKSRKCSICKTKYQPDYPFQRYCSDECKKEGRRIIYQKRIKTLEANRAKKLGKNYEKMSPKVTKKCKVCKKTYEVYRSQIKLRGSSFCSNKCKKLGLTSKKSKKRTLDKVWADLVKQRAAFKCEYCGETKYLNAHHVFSRANHKLRWNVDNGICLCAKHHILGNISAHKAPLEFSEWMKEYKGMEWYNNLLEISRNVDGIIDYEEIKISLDNNKSLLVA